MMPLHTVSPDSNAYAQLTQAFDHQLKELRFAMRLRVEEKGLEAFKQELTGIEANIGALECQFGCLQDLLRKELSAIPKVHTLLRSCQQQKEHLLHVKTSLPARLPARPLLNADSIVNKRDKSLMEERNTSDNGTDKRKAAIRWYITQSELSSLSSYMRGRLTLEKVNAGMDEIASLAENNAKLVAAVRGHHLNRLPLDDRKRAQELYYTYAGREGIKGHKHWFLESDCKGGTHVKVDKTGKSLLLVLRHLGRVQEVRSSAQGKPTAIVYLLSQPSS